jgi:hypothetical protein
MCLLAAHQLDTELMMLPNRDHIFSSFFFCDQSTEAKRTAEMEMNKKLALRPEIFTDLKARLFSEDARHQADVAISKDDPVCGFEVVPLRDQALGVVLYNSIARVVDKQGLRYQMLREIVRQLYVYEQAPTVASSFVYSMYLKTLLRQTPMAA